MLKELHIKGFALIEEIELSFHPGFSVLTGETGAGKSIIIDALSLLLGARASMEMIRTGSQSAVVEGLFDVPESVGPILSHWGHEFSNELLITREIYLNGRNKCRINGNLATLSQLAQIGPLLVDILGQHDQENILDNTKHLDILDAFADLEHERLLTEVKTLYLRYQDIKKERIRLQTQEQNRLARIDLLRFQVNEIDQAHVSVGEEQGLVTRRDMLANAEKITSICQEAYNSLQEEIQGRPALAGLLAQAVNDLAGLLRYDEGLGPLVDLFRGSLIQLEEASSDLRRYLEGFQRDPGQLEKIEERLAVIRALKRKYGDQEQSVLDYAGKAREELADLENSETRIEACLREEQELLDQLKGFTADLTKKRQECARHLEQNIERQLADINMERTKFVAAFDQTALNGTGVDKVEFMIAPNIGEDLKPLTKIASGGEMSRLMLALKNCLAEAEKIPSLVFDEVDSGIGGLTAQKIAVKLQTLSTKFQIFSVTHLPIVASYAQHHYYIEKQEINGRTLVAVSLLTHEERVQELIRMLGGQSNQKATAAHAQELLKRANTS